MVSSDEGPVVKLVTHCRRCGGWLLSASSVTEGIGPTCAVRERAEQRAAELVLFDPNEHTELMLFDIAA